MKIPRLFKVGVRALFAIALAFGLSFDVGAQTTTGKISGRITDARTGEALPGANVILVGTRQGATSNVNGEYFIINVIPGGYSLQGSLIGYQSVSVNDVLVNVDRTSTVNFALNESAVQMEDLVVTAERPPVDMQVSYTQTIMSAAEITQAPVGPRLRDSFATQVGIDTDNWGITIRGGDEEEITYNVDGVGQKDARNSRGYSSYSKTALQEVQILTGGFNAEYGDVRSGVVNVVNKEPRQWLAAGDIRVSGAGPKAFGPEIYSDENWWDVGRFNSMGPTADTDGDGSPDFAGWNAEWASRGGANGDYKAGIFGDAITTPEQAAGIWDWQHREVGGEFGQNLNPSDRDADYTYDVTVGGPLVQDKMSFLVSNRKERSHYAWGMAVPGYRDDTWQARLITTPTATTKLSIGFMRGWSQGGKYGNFLGEFARSPRFEASNFRNANIFNMGSGSNIETITRRHGTLTWTHTLSPKTFYNLTFRTGKTDYLASWQENQNLAGAAAAVYPDGRIEELSGSGDAARAQGAVVLNETPTGFTYRPSSRDILNMYQMSGGSGNPARSGDWSWAYENDFALNVTSQITPNHQIKAGVQAHHFYLREIRGYASTISDPAFRDQDYKPNNIDDPVNAEYTDVADLHNYWIKAPIYGGVFAQDRMEYRQIVVNLGVRLDFHRPDKFFDIPNEQHADWMGSNANLLYESARKVQPPTKWALSPRLGVSHPITAESKLFFNYGHFVQVPSSDDLYETQSGQGEPLEQLGNPWMDMPVTISYELGYERSLAESYLVATTAYFKDIEKEINNQARLYVNSVSSRSTRFHTNAEVKDVRGIELSARKSRGRFLTGFASYDYRVERRREVGWARLYDVKTTSLIPSLRIETSPDGIAPVFKARPVYKVGLTARTPLGYGGESSMLKGGWDGNIYFRHEAGEWFNYNPSNDSALRNIDNAQWISTNRVDVSVSKTFDVKSTPTLYLEVNNLLDGKVPNTNTGRLFETVGGPSSSNEFREYMEALGWRVDTSGNLSEGDKPGTEVGAAASPRRTYMQFFDKRDVFFGVRFSL